MLDWLLICSFQKIDSKKHDKASGIDLTREDLANIIGTSPESLGRSLKQFKDEGIIEIDKRVIYIKNTKQILQLLNVENGLNK